MARPKPLKKHPYNGQNSEEAQSEKKTDRTRPDRVAKLLLRKDIAETVVKSSLLKYVHGDDTAKKNFVNACRQRVDAFSRRVVMASIRLSGLIKYAFHGVEDVRQADLPDIFDTTFVRQLMLGVKDAVQPIPAVVSFLDTHPDELEQFCGERFEGDRNIYSYGAAKYVTNLKNALKANFQANLLAYLKRVVQPDLGLSNEQRSAMLYSIAGWTLPANLQAVDLTAERSRSRAARIAGTVGQWHCD